MPPTEPTVSRTVLQRSELILSASLLGLLIVFLVPLPTVVLDILLSLNLTATVLVLLITLTVRQPLDFSTFPSLLLLLTLFRLALNVATTRLILLNGNAGEIVQAFGQFVVGGNLVVGMVIFAILIIIQFIVITKGAGRVSEVAARFTLDAMPGKQLAIDAEMNAGLINEAEARKRRAALMRESEFYGTMDGASRFVRGDAVAAVIITAVNLIGGIIIGVSKGLSAGAAVKTYSILTIGEGLLAQIPALITATASGILVTKATSGTSLGVELGGQFRTSAGAMRLGSFVMIGLALMPGLPKLPFFILGATLFVLSRRYLKLAAEEEKKEKEGTPGPVDGTTPATTPRPPMEGYLDDFLQNDRLGLEIGNELIPLIGARRGPSLLDRIGSLRRDVAKTSGLWMPTVRVRDNRDLESQAYRVLIDGREVAKGQIRPDLWLAIDPAGGTVQVEGEDAREPAFGLPARWIPDADRQRAVMAGYTVVDAPSVLITHLGEVARKHAHELLSRDDLKELVDRVRTTSAALVDDLIPAGLSMGALHRVLILLLEERVPVTNMTRILECLSANVPYTKDPSELAERIRTELGRAICERFRDPTGRLRAVIFDPRVEMELRRNTQNNKLNLDSSQQEALVIRLANEVRTASQRGYEIALLCDTSMRRAVRYVLSRAIGDLAVLAYQEMPSDVLIEPIAILRPEDLQGGPGTVARMFG